VLPCKAADNIPGGNEALVLELGESVRDDEAGGEESFSVMRKIHSEPKYDAMAIKISL